jgi:hypothetical protein
MPLETRFKSSDIKKLISDTVKNILYFYRCLDLVIMVDKNMCLLIKDNMNINH